jgi:glycosyltransferase involved in cell wall biosynthesis
MGGLRIRFLTSTPLSIDRGSGTYVGIHVLARSLRDLGHQVELETPRYHLPIYTFERIAFNRAVGPRRGFDLTVGFDMDGYHVAKGNPTHIAALKGVIADEVRFERGLTRATMAMQARREREHVQRAARVIVSSIYSAERASEFYGLPRFPFIVPEPIDLAEWRMQLDGNPATSSRFTVLFVGRFYRRKRVDTLLRAAEKLRARTPGIEFRIVGDGPLASSLRRLAQRLDLNGTVSWLGNVTRAQLAAEYNRANVFCMPSEQEAFGIVLAEAMAAGVPVVAARAAAIPEVAPQAAFFPPGDHIQLAERIEALYNSPGDSDVSCGEGLARVRLYDSHLVAEQFLVAATGKIVPAEARS